MNFHKSQYFILAFLLFFISCSTKKHIPVSAETALERYLDNGDKSAQWEIVESYTVNNSDITAYDLKLTSQTWREHIWKHQLTILVPKVIKHDGALLFVTGGSVKDGEPNFKSHDDELTIALGKIAAKNNAIVTIINQAPNQPLYDDYTEDQLISFTLHNFNNDGDFTWPLLFPMVKSAVKAMDAVQEFTSKELKHDIGRFVVSGASKRGWTTWLTGAHDPRVVAIAPMVIDVLNMPVSLEYQIEVWKEFSIQIEDYVKLGIPQQAHTEQGGQLAKMIDPYSYREKLTMPKMIFIGTIDEYWPVDAIKNYIDEIPGQNFIHYVPNAGHDIWDETQTWQALSSFFSTTLLNQPYPICNWNISPNETNIKLVAATTAETLVDATIWSADSEDRDFRDEEWTGVSLNAKNMENVEAEINYPESGFKAFYLDLKYTDPNGEEYTESTRMFVTNEKAVL